MIDLLVQTFKIEPIEAKIFAQHFNPKQYAINDRFVALGNVCSQVGFIEKGSFKSVLITKDRELTDDFIFERQFISNYYSLLSEEPSNKEIIAMEDSRLLVISKAELEALAEKFAFVENLIKEVTKRLFLSSHRKLESLKLKSAEERYLHLLSTRPNLVHKLPHYEIASYLNLSPETINRIRAKQKLNS